MERISAYVGSSPGGEEFLVAVIQLGLNRIMGTEGAGAQEVFPKGLVPRVYLRGVGL